MLCNTTAAQSMVLSATLATGAGLNLGFFPSSPPSLGLPVNFSTAGEIWGQAVTQALIFLIPSDGTSVFYPVLAAQNLSYLSIGYSRKPLAFR